MSTLQKEPVRPNMPIEGRSRDTWANDYDPDLSRWYYTCKERHPTSAEWDGWVDDQFNLQITMDETP